MPDEDLERYQQSPREFRESVRNRLSDWRWLSGSHSRSAWRPPYPEQQRRITEEVAHKLYLNRLQLKRPGDAQSDWKRAERIIRNPLRNTLFAINQPLIKVEKAVWEPLLAWADNQALLSLLGIIGNAGIIIAIFTFIGTEKQRRDAEVLNAWQTLTSAYEQSGSGGRIRALEFLNASPRNRDAEYLGANWRRKFPWVCAPHPLCTWPAEKLDGINLAADNGPQVEQSEGADDEEQPMESTPGVYLRGIQLPGASLESANLKGGVLVGANLQGANLMKANLRKVNLYRANLQGANLMKANLQGADLFEANLQEASLGIANLQEANLQVANLQGAGLWNANLQRAWLMGVNLQEAFLGIANLQEAFLGIANLQGAFLRDANLQEARLWAANLQGADLRAANLQESELIEANLEGAVGLTQDQLTQAKLCRTKIPEGITLDPNRDCEELGIDPETGWPVDP